MVTAQIRNLDTNSDEILEPNFYYSDLDHLLDPYVGTWQYTNGTTLLKIKLEKKEHYLLDSNQNIYIDLIVGEFQYVENGNIIIDRIPLLNDTSIDYLNYSMVSFGFFRINHPNFPEANPSIRMIQIVFDDPVRTYLEYSGKMAINDEVENEKLIFSFRRDIGGSPDGASFAPVFPTGKYVLSKVP